MEAHKNNNGREGRGVCSRFSPGPRAARHRTGGCPGSAARRDDKVNIRLRAEGLCVT